MVNGFKHTKGLGNIPCELTTVLFNELENESCIELVNEEQMRGSSSSTLRCTPLHTLNPRGNLAMIIKLSDGVMVYKLILPGWIIIYPA